MQNLNTQQLVTLGALLRNGQKASAYRLVEGSALTPSNRDNINAIARGLGVTYTYGPHKDGRKYWKATYN